MVGMGAMESDQDTTIQSTPTRNEEEYPQTESDASPKPEMNEPNTETSSSLEIIDLDESQGEETDSIKVNYTSNLKKKSDVSMSEIPKDANAISDKKRKSTDIGTTQTLAKKKKQSQLNFSALKGTGPITLKLKPGSPNSRRSLKPQSTSKKTDQDVLEVSSETKTEEVSPISKNKDRLISASSENRPADVTSSSKKLFVKIPLKNNVGTDSGRGASIIRFDSSSAVPASSSSDDFSFKSKNITFKLKPITSRTTIVRDRSKLVRSNPGPLVSLNYDLYDDNLINAPSNEAVAGEKLAFGFPVNNKPWLLDLTYIIAFLNTFKEIIQIGPLGPSDFETGLCLQIEEGSGTRTSEFSSVSPAMDLLFRKLLALVLNRKKPIARDGQRSALQELKSKYITFGLPMEWRDDSSIHVTNSIECNVVQDRVDDSKPDISLDEKIEFEGPQELLNPFHEVGFEKHGISGIKSPDDRCVMLRCLVTWCFSESTTIKQYFTDAVNKQDASGERDTSYASRAILRGFAQTVEMKRDLDRKFSKKSKQRSSTDVTDTAPVYFDPTSDPLSHPLSFRFNEFIVGDCGFHIGRFYLVRMADSTSGRVSSLDQMRNSTKDFASVRSSAPSGFALYVEDVHTLLLESLAEYGIEFDTDGKEIKTDSHVDESQHWYCIASTCEELENFLDHLSDKLGISKGSSNTIPLSSVAYKPTLHMYNYLSSILPMLREYEHLSASSVGSTRASRRKRVEYVAQPVSDHEEYLGGADEDYSEQEEQDDEYLD